MLVVAGSNPAAAPTLDSVAEGMNSLSYLAIPIGHKVGP